MTNSKPNQLSRRDFLKLSSTASLGLAMSACGFTPKPIATPKRTNTPLPTSTLTPTPTLTPTLTPTNTLASTATLAPTETPTPTETPMPAQIIFKGDFEDGLNITGFPGWNNLHTHGGKVDIVTSADGGHALLNYIDGNPYLLDNGVYEIRIGPDWFNKGGYKNTPAIPAPCSISCDVTISHDMLNTIKDNDRQGYPLYLNLLGFHTNRVTDGVERYRSGFSSGFVFNPDGRLYMTSHYEDLGNFSHYRTNNRIIPGVAAILMFMIDNDGHVIPYVNGERAIDNLNEVVTIDPELAKVGYTDGHAGIFFYLDDNKHVPQQGASVINDN